MKILEATTAQQLHFQDALVLKDEKTFSVTEWIKLFHKLPLKKRVGDSTCFISSWFKSCFCVFLRLHGTACSVSFNFKIAFGNNRESYLDGWAYTSLCVSAVKAVHNHFLCLLPLSFLHHSLPGYCGSCKAHSGVIQLWFVLYLHRAMRQGNGFHHNAVEPVLRNQGYCSKQRNCAYFIFLIFL